MSLIIIYACITMLIHAKAVENNLIVLIQLEIKEEYWTRFFPELTRISIWIMYISTILAKRCLSINTCIICLFAEMYSCMYHIWLGANPIFAILRSCIISSSLTCKIDTVFLTIFLTYTLNVLFLFRKVTHKCRLSCQTTEMNISITVTVSPTGCRIHMPWII